VQPCWEHYLTFNAPPSMNLCRNCSPPGEIEAVHPITRKTRLTAPLSEWHRACRLPPFWAKSAFAFE
jgi:hypothetical protein